MPSSNGSTLHEQNGAPNKRKSKRDKAQEQVYTPESEESARKPTENRPHAFNTLAWLVEGATGLIEELRHNDLGLPEDFWVHAYAARRESLLALRAVLDDLIEKSESAQRQEEDKQKRRERRGGIEIG